MSEPSTDTRATTIQDLALEVRSKNAGPFWVTMELFMQGRGRLPDRGRPGVHQRGGRRPPLLRRRRHDPDVPDPLAERREDLLPAARSRRARCATATCTWASTTCRWRCSRCRRPVASEPIDRTALRVAVAVLVGSFPTILGTTTVSVALHELGTALGVGVDLLSWVTTAYLLALCTAIPVVGWLQGLLGARRLWIAALAVFLAGSLLCGAAWDAQALIVARVVQGLGGGVMMPLLTTILVQATPRSDRARVTSFVALTTALGPILGAVVGGLVLGVADWRWLFWGNVPLALTGLVLAWWLIPPDGPRRRTRLDVVGVASATGTLRGPVGPVGHGGWQGARRGGPCRRRHGAARRIRGVGPAPRGGGTGRPPRVAVAADLVSDRRAVPLGGRPPRGDV